MNYRVLLLVPAGITFDMLTEEQQAAIAGVFGQYVLPMPGTTSANGKSVCDGVAASNFDASTLGPLGLPFEVIGQWQDDGTVVVPLDAALFLQHLPSGVDEQGNTVAPVLHEPHRWAGWPELF